MKTFLEFINSPSAREWGKDSLKVIYQNDTPGEPKRKKVEKKPNRPCQYQSP